MTTRRDKVRRVIEAEPRAIGSGLVARTKAPKWVPIVCLVIVILLFIALIIMESVRTFNDFTRYGQQRTSDQAITVISLIVIVFMAGFGLVAYLTKSRQGLT